MPARKIRFVGFGRFGRFGGFGGFVLFGFGVVRRGGHGGSCLQRKRKKNILKKVQTGNRIRLPVLSIEKVRGGRGTPTVAPSAPVAVLYQGLPTGLFCVLNTRMAGDPSNVL